jgi:hypothetical protein
MLRRWAALFSKFGANFSNFGGKFEFFLEEKSKAENNV